MRPTAIAKPILHVYRRSMAKSSIELNELNIATAAAQQQHFFVRKSESESESDQKRWKRHRMGQD
jgi:hypothetical protein